MLQDGRGQWMIQLWSCGKRPGVLKRRGSLLTGHRNLFCGTDAPVLALLSQRAQVLGGSRRAYSKENQCLTFQITLFSGTGRRASSGTEVTLSSHLQVTKMGPSRSVTLPEASADRMTPAINHTPQSSPSSSSQTKVTIPHV